MDGANGSRKFFAITLSLLSPVILFTLVMQIIVTIQAFTQAYIIDGRRARLLPCIEHNGPDLKIRKRGTCRMRGFD